MTSGHRTDRPTRIRIGRNGRATTLQPGEFVSPRIVARDGNRVRICLVGHQAMLLAGDRLRIEIEVTDGAEVELVESAATVAYNGRGGRATWDAQVRVADSGSLIWRSEPFVVAAGADVERSVDLCVESGGVAVTAESLVLGRHHEPGGAVVCKTRAVLDTRPMLMETLDLRDPVARSRPGLLGDFRVLSSVLAVGLAVCPAVTRYATPLAGAGGLARVLATDAHRAEAQIRPIRAAWQESVRSRQVSPAREPVAAAVPVG